MASFLADVKDFIMGKPEDSYDGYDEYDDYDEADEYESGSSRSAAYGYEDEYEEPEEEVKERVSFADRFRSRRSESRSRSRLFDREETVEDSFDFDEPAPAKKPAAQIKLVKAQSYDECRRIAGELKAMRSVVVNFEDMEIAEARRLSDFLCGTTFAQDGQIQKLSYKTYIFAVGGVDLVGSIDSAAVRDGYYTFTEER